MQWGFLFQQWFVDFYLARAGKGKCCFCWEWIPWKYIWWRKTVYGGEEGVEWVPDAISFHFRILSPFAFSSMILSSASFILPSFQNLGICFSSSIPGSLAQPRLQARGCLPWRRPSNHKLSESTWQVQRQLHPSLNSVLWLSSLQIP